MNYIQSKPYTLFLGLILVLLSFGFYKRKETIDINIHDTYFVISWIDGMILISLIYGLLGLIYLALLKLKFKPINWMTITHVLISIIGLLVIFILSKLIRESIVPGDFIAMLDNIRFNEKIIYGIWFSVFAVIGIQLLFFINVIYALIKGRS